MKFFSILREPDMVWGATEKTPFRFEEEGICDVEYKYEVGESSARVVVYPSPSPIKYLKLRWNGEQEEVDLVYGDLWERSGGPHSYLEWRAVMPHRALPWFCYLKAGENMACYGVKTGADCFAFWQVDTHGITLFLNLMNGQGGVELKEPLTACEVVELINDTDDSYRVAQKFAHKMCDAPLLPSEPIFGVNNWYWAYGKITFQSVLEETDYLMKMCEGTSHRPYMIIDDGWQKNRTFGEGAYIGGPWIPNDKFGDMAKTAAAIHEKGAKAGLWFRPLLVKDAPEEMKYGVGGNGIILDPSHPKVLEQVEKDAARIADWGFDLIKHDFTTIDICGPQDNGNTYPESIGDFYDKSRTTATIIKDLYRAIGRGAGAAEVIGCNTISHLTAGIHSTYRVGNDTSGRSFEWTRRYGVNSVMRLPLNDALYRVDPDCAAFTEMVDKGLNLDYLEMCALTGMTTLASVTPHILSEEELRRINEIFKIADKDELRLGIRNYHRNSNPESFASEDSKIKKSYRWDSAYNGARTVLGWME